MLGGGPPAMFGGGKGMPPGGIGPPGPGGPPIGMFGGGKGIGGILGPGPPRPMNGGGGIPGMPRDVSMALCDYQAQIVPGGGNPCGGKPGPPGGGKPPIGFCVIGFACPSALYASVILLITSCVCSLDISAVALVTVQDLVGEDKRTFVVCLDIAQMVTTGVVRFTDAHRVVGKVDIAVITCRVISYECDGSVQLEVGTYRRT